MTFAMRTYSIPLASPVGPYFNQISGSKISNPSLAYIPRWLFLASRCSSAYPAYSFFQSCIAASKSLCPIPRPCRLSMTPNLCNWTCGRFAYLRRESRSFLTSSGTRAMQPMGLCLLVSADECPKDSSRCNEVSLRGDASGRHSGECPIFGVRMSSGKGEFRKGP